MIVIPPPISIELARARQRELHAERRRLAERRRPARFRRAVQPR